MSSQREPGRWVAWGPRVWASVLAMVIVLAVGIVVIALLIGNDDENKGLPLPDDAVVATDAWVRVVPVTLSETPVSTESGMAEGGGEAMPSTGNNAGAFMTLTNTMDTDARLVGVAVDPSVARVAELHQTTIDENQVMRMQPLDWIDIPANGEVQLAPGGLHIMLLDVQPDVKPGDTVELTLNYADGTSYAVLAEVRAAE